MRVCKVWDSDYPWDVRVEKIWNSFIESGHDVHLVCRNRNKIRPKYEIINGLHIHRLPVINKKLASLISFPFFLNPLWLYTIYSVVSKHKIDCIVVRDLPMALAGIIVAKLKRVPCFIDMAEPYPEMLEGYHVLQKVSIYKKVINLIIRNYHLSLIIEKISCKLSDHIFPVSKEIKNGLIRKGISKSKITVFHNTPTVSFIQSCNNYSTKLKCNSNDCLNIVYVGDLTEARGVPLVIDAVEELNKKQEQYNFVIIGGGRYFDYLKKLVVKKNIEESVVFAGWVKHNEIVQYIKKCDIGIIPHLPTKHNNLTLPNKVFDYMAIGLPVLSGNLLPVKSILEETHAGLIFDDQSMDSVVHQLLKLKDKKIRDQFGINGKKAVIQKYNWEIDFSIFLNTIKKYVS